MEEVGCQGQGTQVNVKDQGLVEETYMRMRQEGRPYRLQYLSDEIGLRRQGYYAC